MLCLPGSGVEMPGDGVTAVEEIWVYREGAGEQTSI